MFEETIFLKLLLHRNEETIVNMLGTAIVLCTVFFVYVAMLVFCAVCFVLLLRVFGRRRRKI